MTAEPIKFEKMNFLEEKKLTRKINWTNSFVWFIKADCAGCWIHSNENRIKYLESMEAGLWTKIFLMIFIEIFV